MDRSEWKWFGNHGHLVVGQWCRFHLCTKVGGYLVSTVGQYWPEHGVREIHAKVHDPQWLSENGHLKGDYFDLAYMERFGYEEIGYDRKFETMVFRAGEPCKEDRCGCGMPIPSDWGELDFNAYNDARSATDGHMRMCEKWAAKEATWQTGKPLKS